MPALRLKTKLVFAITAMVVVIVASLAALYISEVVHQRIQEEYDLAEVITHHVFAVAKPALGVDLSSSKINLNDPLQVEAAVQELLQYDTGITALMESVTGDSQSILDASVVDAKDLALLHTNPILQGTIVAPREDFANVVHGGIWKQIKLIYGPAKTYEIRLSLIHVATGKAFGEVRVGVYTDFLKQQVQPQIQRARVFAGHVVDGAPERSQASPAGLKRDLGDRHGGLRQQPPCGLQPRRPGHRAGKDPSCPFIPPSPP